MTFEKAITIIETIRNIENEKYLFPAIQREFIWKHEKIEWLFDSIMRGYPISSFLFWKVEDEEQNKYKFYKFLKEYRERYKIHNELKENLNKDFYAILDGQQRLTSLYIGLKGSFSWKKPNYKWENTEEKIPTRKLYLNIEKELEKEEDGRIYEFKFLTNDEKNKNENKWFEVGSILNYEKHENLDDYVDSINNRFSKKTIRRLRECIFKEELINFYLEKEQNLDKVLNIFIRINSGGEPLNFSDLILSITISIWEEARDKINKLINEINEIGFSVKKDLILKTFLFLYSNDIKFKVTNFKKEKAENLKNNWENISLSIREIFKTIKKLGFEDSTITSKNSLIPLIYFIYHKNIYKNFSENILNKENRKLMKKFLQLIIIKKIFGAGSGDGILTIIRNSMSENIKNKEFLKKEIVEFPLNLIKKKLEITEKTLKIDDEYLEELLKEQKDSNISFSILSLLYPNLDYNNNNFHKDHLFPISKFNKKEINNNINIKDKDFYLNSDNNNSILNLQLLDGNENSSKNNKDLKQWVDERKEETNFFQNHLIPKENLEFENFKKFIEERKIILKNKLRDLINN